MKIILNMIRNKVFVLLFLLGPLSAQSQSITAHVIDNFPQAHLTHVSYFPTYSFTGAVPFLGHNALEYNSNLSFLNFLSPNTDESYSFDKNKLISNLDDLNYFYGESVINVVTSTWVKGELYFDFNLANHFIMEARFPKDYLLYGWKGHENFIDKPAILDGFGIDFLHYNEISFGVTQNIDDKVRIGTRVKWLQGLASQTTLKSDIEMQYDPAQDQITGQADFLTAISGPIDTNGLSINSYNDYVFNPLNMGFGVDVGISFYPIKDLKLSADMYDLGLIRWKFKTKSYAIQNKSFTANNFEFKDPFKMVINDSTYHKALDSINSIFEPVKYDSNFTTYISPKIFLSASYNLNENNKVGLTYMYRMNKYYNTKALALFYSKEFGRFLNTTVNYSVVNGTYHRMGMGIVARLGTLHLYVITDDVFRLFDFGNAKYTNLHFGLNIVRKIDEYENNLNL